MLKFEVDIHTLANGLKEVKRALTGKTAPYSATSGIKIVANEDGIRLTTVTPGVDMMVQSKLAAKAEDSVIKVDQSGAVLVDAKRFIEYIVKAKAKTVKVEEVDEEAVIVRAGRGKMTFNKLRLDSFPAIEIENNQNTFAVNSNCFLRGLQSTVLFTGNGDRPILSGVLFKIGESKITLRATDSFRIGQDVVDILTKVNETLDVVVPSEFLKKTFTLFSRGETVNITTDSRWIRFEAGEEVVAMRLLDGEYPNLDVFIDEMKGGEQKLRFLRDELIQLTDRALLFKSEQNGEVIQMKWEKGATEVTFKTKSSIGTSTETIETEVVTTTASQIHFNAEFLKDTLRSFPKSAEEIEFDMYGELSKFMVKEVGNDESVRIIVPVRVE